jgi:hypothetical protein
MSSCSCGCSPCCCNTSGETDASECIDPGIVKTAAYASVINEDMCGRRLAAYRGLRDDGTPDTRPSSPLKGAVMTQNAEGIVGWAAGSCGDPPKKIVKVANDTDAATATNFVARLVGKDDDHCDVSLAGSADAASGQWKLVWVSSMQKWTTVPDTGEGSVNTDLCTTLVTALVISPGTEEYVTEVLATEHVAAGVSIKIQGYEFVVTEVINTEYLRVELLDTISAPVTIAAGETVCNIGFRPCPRSVAPYADNIVACLNGGAVAVELPDDVNDVAVPGFWWRDQLGRVQFVAAPVDETTGLIKPSYALRTPAVPQAGGANLPSFTIISQKPTWLASKVVVASKFVGSPVAPAFAIEDDVVSVTPHTGSFDMDGGSIPGYVTGYSVAVLRASVYVDPGLGGTTCLAQVQVNGLILTEGWVSSSGTFAFQSSVVFEAPLTNDAFTYAVIASGGALSFAKLEVIGFK